MGKVIDLTGQRFGHLVVTGFNRKENKVYYWNCQCDCGRAKVVRSSTLRGSCLNKPGPCKCKGIEENKQNWVGKRSGMMEVVEERRNTGKGLVLICRCDCGVTKEVGAKSFKIGKTRSCGCSTKAFLSKANSVHGKGDSPEYEMLRRIKHKSKQYGIRFNLDISDIHIPEFCPLLGIPLRTNNGTPKFDSASLDKIDPALGYVRGNVWVISLKANQMKSNASLEEVKLLATNFEKKIKEGLNG